MALNLEQSSGITAQFGNAVFANSAGANTNVTTTNATTYAIAGLAYNVAAKTAAAFTNLNDYRTGALPTAILGAQAAVVVIGFDSSGALQFVQGPIQSYPASAQVAGSTVFPFPPIPAGMAPIAYQIVKNKNTAGTAGFTWGTSNFNASNVAFDTAVQLTQLPNTAVVNTAA